jgi:hypothetical protein
MTQTHARICPAPPRGRRHLRRLSALLAVGVLTAGVSVSVVGPVQAAPTTKAGQAPAVAAAGQPDLGANVYVFTPSMPQASIQSTVDSIATQQVSNQFGPQRYSLLFEPGTYGSTADPLTFQVGYYTQVAGLGTSPQDVTINGTIDVYNQCFPPTAPDTSNCTALDNFWATAQAAPMRRVNLTGGSLSLMDYCSAGPQYASGGYIADSAFSGGTVINGTQQQFVVRNSNLDGWSNGVWNNVFSGDIGAPAQSFGVAGGAGPYTTLNTSPVTAEEPFLTDAAGRFSVFVPAVRTKSSGTSWATGSTAGTTIPIRRFFIANPSTPVPVINLALLLGQNLILTPGVYKLNRPIEVTRANTVVLGLGFATLVPQRGNLAMRVSDVPGVKLSGMIFDAGPVNSPALLQLGGGLPFFDRAGRANNPTLVQDVFFRIGGATPGRAATSLVVNSSNVILDDIWAWRADHGSGVGWSSNVAKTGVIINGDDVTAYGLFVEHYQGFQVIWNGENGTDIFFQNEMPYDVPDQAAWMSSPTTEGYAAFLVPPRVKAFQGYGMGSYSFFNQGLDIQATQAFQVPRVAGVQLHDLLTVFLNGSGSINSVVDGTGAAVTSAQSGTPSTVVSFP